MPPAAVPIEKRFNRLRERVTKQRETQKNIAHDVAKASALAVLADRNSSWVEQLNRTERLEREIADLKLAMKRLVRYVSRLDHGGA